MFRALVAVPAVALVLLTAACGGDDPAPETTASAAPSTSTGAPSGTAPAFAGTEIKVAIADGYVDPKPVTREVSKGTRVKIVVSSDKADELHIHGYDLPAKLEPGKPAVIEFTADQTGRFEVETHDSKLVLFVLQVS